MGGELTIAPATLAYIEVLATLHAESFAPSWDAEAFASLLNGGANALIARTPEGPLGMAVFRIILDEAEILTIATQPGVRRSGVGARLLDATIQQLQSAGVAFLHLEVAVDNAPALALYRRAGFEQTGRRRGYYQRGDQRIDALVLRRVLNTQAH